MIPRRRGAAGEEIMGNESKIAGTIDEFEIEFLIDQALRFIEDLYLEMCNGFHLRAGGDIDQDTAYIFFRSKERIDNLKMLLQYLIYFVREVSYQVLMHDDLQKPFHQFRAFIQNHVGLLAEDDVKSAIMREYVRRLPIAEHSLDDFERRIEAQHQMLNAMLAGADKPSPEGFFKLFDALRQTSRFWLELKDHQCRRIRRSDFYIYKFSRLLLEKYTH